LTVVPINSTSSADDDDDDDDDDVFSVYISFGSSKTPFESDNSFGFTFLERS